MKTILIYLLLVGNWCLVYGETTADSAPMRKLAEKTKELATSAGFSDEDAITSGVFLLEQLEGPRPPEAKLSVRVSDTKANSVTVFVAYDFGLKSRGYEIEFGRGDIQKYERWAYFKSLKFIPSE